MLISRSKNELKIRQGLQKWSCGAGQFIGGIAKIDAGQGQRTRFDSLKMLNHAKDMSESSVVVGGWNR